MRDYRSEADKVRDLPHVMKFITGTVLDVGCGHDKILPTAIGADGRALDGVDVVCSDAGGWELAADIELHFSSEDWEFDTVFSSHFLEHLPDQHRAIEVWHSLLNPGGHLVLYLPDGRHYDNKENPEHMVDINYDNFMFWFRRAFCGEGKDFYGEHLEQYFELIDSGMDVGKDRYSFYVIARRV